MNIKCAHSFKNWLRSNTHYSKVYDFIGSPKPTDVTFLDGVTMMNRTQQDQMNAKVKLELYHKLSYNYQFKNIEVGSIASSKIFPSFSDTIKLNKQIQQFYKDVNPLSQVEIPNHYVVIPSEKQFNKILPELKSIQNFSFITSVSDAYQYKNTNMSVRDSIQNISNMMIRLDETKRKFGSKLYVSCINECPIDGRMKNDYVVDKLQEFQNLKTDTMCLSDTYGTLKSKDFEYIIKKALNAGISHKNLSLHLHVKHGCENNVEKICHIALDHGINNFDVSAFESGGFINHISFSSASQPNLTYPLYYKFLQSYIISKTD